MTNDYIIPGALLESIKSKFTPSTWEAFMNQVHAVVNSFVWTDQDVKFFWKVEVPNLAKRKKRKL